MKSGTRKRLAARPFVLRMAIIFAVVLGSLLPTIHTPTAQGFQRQPNRAEYAPGQLIVKLKGEIQSQMLERHRLTVHEDLLSNVPQITTLSASPAQEHLYLFETDPGADMEVLAAELTAEENVEYAEPNYKYFMAALPNDPMIFANPFQDGQWDLDDTDFFRAWDYKTSRETIVANFDTGGDLNHPDLAANTWHNDKEVGGLPGVDDDGNGYVDDKDGWNFADDNNDVQDRDAVSHGTATEGRGACGNNGLGIAGAAWQGKMMNIKVARDFSTFTGDLVRAIRYVKTTASLQGKRVVINMSFGGMGRSQALADEIRDSGMLIVAATGNSGFTDPTAVFYPAAYNQECPNVLSVTATTYNPLDSLVPGASWVGSDIGAPGASILTTQLGGGYTHTGGTSLSAPLVAQALAMILDIEPDIYKAKARLLKSADIIPALVGKVKGGLRLNIDRALRGDFNPNFPPTIAVNNLSYTVAEGVPLALIANVSDPDGDPLTTQWQFSDGQSFTGTGIAPVFSLGTYQGMVTVSDGIAQATLTVTIQVTDRVEVRPKVKGVKKLILTVTSSRQNQNPRPKIVIRELNQEIPYEQESQAYRIVLKLKQSAIPSPLTIESELGGTVTLSWR